MNLIVQHCYVADFDGTTLQDTFAELDGSTPVVQAYDSDSGHVCALAQAEGQPIEATEQEARYRLAVHVHGKGAAGDPNDPRA